MQTMCARGEWPCDHEPGRHHTGYIHKNDSHAHNQMLYRLIVGFKNAVACKGFGHHRLRIKLALGGRDVSFAPTKRGLPYFVSIHAEAHGLLL